MKLTILASGSKANAAILEANGTRLLIDAGLSASQLNFRLGLADMRPHDITACLLTHEHSDHSAGLKFCEKFNIPVYSNVLTAMAIAVKEHSGRAWRSFDTGDGFYINDIHVETFSVPHDAADPCGFIFTSDESALGFVTDLGNVNESVLNRLQRVSSLLIEANYDEGVLTTCGRPRSVVSRIMSDHGHLSNRQAAEACLELPELRKAILGHLSRETNSPGIAVGAVKFALEQTIEVQCAHIPEEQRCDPPPVFEIL